jgi:hypothetical protein
VSYTIVRILQFLLTKFAFLSLQWQGSELTVTRMYRPEFLVGMEARNPNNFKLTENRVYFRAVFASTLTFCTGNGDRKTSCLWLYRKLKDRPSILSRWRHDAGVTCSCNRQDTIVPEAGSFTGTKYRSSDQQRYRTSWILSHLSHKWRKIPSSSLYRGGKCYTPLVWIRRCFCCW